MSRIKRLLEALNGSDRAAVRLLTGLTDKELDELGGFGDENESD